MPNICKAVCVLLAALLVACGGSDGSSHSEARLASVEGVITDQNNLVRQGDDNLIAADQMAVIDIYGQDLNVDLRVSLNGASCLTHDLEYLDNEEQDNDLMIISADCPAQSVGRHVLQVVDRGTTVFETSLEAVSPTVLVEQRDAMLAKIRPTYGPQVNPLARGSQNLPSLSPTTYSQSVVVSAVANTVRGQVTAERPFIDTATGALSYSNIMELAVRGVVVQLLDTTNGNAELDSTATDSSGIYVFNNVPVNKRVIVRVKAQIARNRAANDTSAPRYNMMVRDNTRAGAEKPVYTMESASFVTQAAGNVVALKATLGFDSEGKLTSPEGRVSGPYALLDVVYNALSKIVETNPGVALKDVNIYWSANNLKEQYQTEAEKVSGRIGTSHFSDSGAYPGLFILGQINIDTDEFDSGVVGHEFGHYLQDAVSYSDSPGFDHGAKDYKDPSLAYGEGFGTAIGGLLSKSYYFNDPTCLNSFRDCTNLYTDSSGSNQSYGSSTDLKVLPAADSPNGFYSEISVGYLLYKLGTDYGFTPFWKTLAAMAQGYESATVFNFLNLYVGQQTAVSRAQLQGLAALANIKTTDPLGSLPAGTAPDPAIGQVTSGAPDLETVYFTLSPIAPRGDSPQKLTASSPAFCMNARLYGAASPNGLGVSRRFKVVAPYTGTMGALILGPTGETYLKKVYDLDVRDGTTGKKTSIYLWDEGDGYRWKVTAGATYTILVQFQKAVYDKGNVCGNQILLWQPTLLP